MGRSEKSFSGFGDLARRKVKHNMRNISPETRRRLLVACYARARIGLANTEWFSEAIAAAADVVDAVVGPMPAYYCAVSLSPSGALLSHIGAQRRCAPRRYVYAMLIETEIIAPVQHLDSDEENAFCLAISLYNALRPHYAGELLVYFKI